MDINELRANINQTDDELKKLFERRMETSADIAVTKASMICPCWTAAANVRLLTA